MTEFIQVHTTTSTREEALKIAETVVSRRLASACWVSSPVTSFYWWKGKMEQVESWVCLMKTRRDLYPRLEQTIKELHSYEEPAVVATPIVEGSPTYLEWIAHETIQP